MEGLQARGLCEVVLGTPKRFVPVPFGDFLERVKREHQWAIESLDRRRDELEALLVVQAKPRLSDRGRVQLVTGRAAILELEARLVDGASEGLLMMCTPGRMKRMQRVFSVLEGAAARGVKIRVLAPPTPSWLEDAALFSRVAQVRARAHDEDPRSGSVAFVVVDRTHALIVDAVPDHEHLHQGHDVATFMTEAGLVSATRDLLEALWAQAPAAPPAGMTARERG